MASAVEVPEDGSNRVAPDDFSNASASVSKTSDESVGTPSNKPVTPTKNDGVKLQNVIREPIGGNVEEISDYPKEGSIEPVEILSTAIQAEYPCSDSLVNVRPEEGVEDDGPCESCQFIEAEADPLERLLLESSQTNHIPKPHAVKDQCEATNPQPEFSSISALLASTFRSGAEHTGNSGAAQESLHPNWRASVDEDRRAEALRVPDWAHEIAKDRAKLKEERLRAPDWAGEVAKDKEAEAFRRAPNWAAEVAKDREIAKERRERFMGDIDEEYDMNELDALDPLDVEYYLRPESTRLHQEVCEERSTEEKNELKIKGAAARNHKPKELQRSTTFSSEKENHRPAEVSVRHAPKAKVDWQIKLANRQLEESGNLLVNSRGQGKTQLDPRVYRYPIAKNRW
ncbi:hypothetical protein FA15DRAFT_659114 [Coprinopsis marcescibilis]|uniref:Uncharacterized protein n=1 Tax=Coprinopsis marcescibilis TaxID=230819 RepID=A0A5C3KJT5_COPMA|nr:hypothetical protein FA15DRAFT_659114 [Coprinopsis marcescibilis]